jgi:CheY-like chemotaxis protein
LPAVTVNQTALRQVCLSVIGWALDASPGGAIGLSVAEAGPGVGISIQVDGWRDEPVDDGDDRSRLRLGQRLLEMQGGTLEILAKEARTFRMRLVLPSARAPAILVVDDNPDVLRLFQRYIQSPTVHLIQATTAEQALQLVRDARPRLITLDLMMPVRDGWDLLQVLTRDPSTRDIPVAVCSVVHERSLALAMGASYFLPKPVSRAELLQVLEQCRLGPVDRLEAGP